MTDIGIGQTERQSPHKGLGWVPFLAADATERVSLPDGYEHIQVTWRDIDDVQWCREFIEQDFVLKRLSAPADD